MLKNDFTARIVAVYGTVYIAYYNSHFYSCTLAGRFRTKKNSARHPLTIGDEVTLSINKDEYLDNTKVSSIFKPLNLSDDTVIISKIHKHKNELVRSDGTKAHKLGVNLDQVFLIQAFDSPKLNWNFIFRVNASALAGKSELHIFINKADLIQSEINKLKKNEAKILNKVFNKLLDKDIIDSKTCDSLMKKIYPLSSFRRFSPKDNGLNKADKREDSLTDKFYKFLYLSKQGLQLHFISAEKNKISSFKKQAADKFTLIVGPSGVGKSTLINKLCGKELLLKTREISELSNKGRHTTTTSLTIPLPKGGFLVDTPGIKTWGLAHLSKEDIQYSFTEIKEAAQHCAFKDCRHQPGAKDCMVLTNAQENSLFAWRLKALESFIKSIDYPDRIRKGDHLKGLGARKRKKRY